MEFVIDRSKWRCGGDENTRGLGSALLLNEEGFMCCLGQCSAQLGVSAEKLLNKTMPGAVGEKIPYLTDAPSGISIWNTPLSRAAADLNDCDDVDDADRELQLTALFTKHGHTITFTGEYVKPDAVADLSGEGK